MTSRCRSVGLSVMFVFFVGEFLSVSCLSVSCLSVSYVTLLNLPNEPIHMCISKVDQLAFRSRVAHTPFGSAPVPTPSS